MTDEVPRASPGPTTRHCALLVLYIVPDCLECERARALLRSRGVTWHEVDVSRIEMLPRREMLLRGGSWHVPLLRGAGLVQIGYDEPAFLAIVNAVLEAEHDGQGSTSGDLVSW